MLRLSRAKDAAITPDRTSFSAHLSQRALWWPLIAVVGLLGLLAVGPLVLSSRSRALRSTLIDVVDPARLNTTGLSAALAEEMFALAMRANVAEAHVDPRYESARRSERAHANALDSLVGRLSADVVERFGLYREAAARWHDDAAEIGSRVTHRAELDTARSDGLAALDAAADLAALLDREYAAGRDRVRRIENIDVLLPTVIVPLALLACGLLIRAGRRTVDIAIRAERDRLALAEAMEQKNGLLRGISHDLQNPLGAALGYADLILDEVVEPPDQRNTLVRIRRLLTASVETVRDLLAVARSDDGALRVERRRVLLEQIAKDAVDDHSLAAHAKGHRVSYLALSECPTRGDAGRIRHILDNLLSNASKYTPSGGRIQVVVAMREIDGKTWSTVTVSDSGPGIPSDSVERVFEEFYRVPSSQDVAPGAGIGLSVSRRVARLMGGEVTLDVTGPTEGEDAPSGASFTLRLPPDDEGERSRIPERRAEA